GQRWPLRTEPQVAEEGVERRVPWWAAIEQGVTVAAPFILDLFVGRADRLEAFRVVIRRGQLDRVEVSPADGRVIRVQRHSKHQGRIHGQSRFIWFGSPDGAGRGSDGPRPVARATRTSNTSGGTSFGNVFRARRISLSDMPASIATRAFIISASSAN